MKASDKSKISKALVYVLKAEGMLSMAEDCIFNGDSEKVSDSMTSYDVVKRLRESATEFRKDIESAIKLFEDL